MAGMTDTTRLTDSLQRHFSKELLDRMIPNLVYSGFALRAPLPKKGGSKTIRLFRFDTPATTDIGTPTEGTPRAANTYRQLGLEYVDADLVQYVQTIQITDIAEATSMFNLIEQANMQNAEDAALHADTIVQNEINVHTGTVGNVNYANKNFIYANADANYAAVYNGGTKNSSHILTAANILDGATSLKVQMAPRINGSYVMAVPPQVARDIMNGANSNTTWADAAKYSAVTQLFNGEVGKLYGVRVVEHNNPWRSAATQGTYSGSGIVFSAFMFGRGAYAVPDLSELGSPFSPQVSIVQGADKSDPANLIKALVSFKTFYVAKVTQPKWITHFYTQSGSSA